MVEEMEMTSVLAVISKTSGLSVTISSIAFRNPCHIAINSAYRLN
jgi:hypothetical protein